MISLRKERKVPVLEKDGAIQEGNYELLKFYTSQMPTLCVRGPVSERRNTGRVRVCASELRRQEKESFGSGFFNSIFVDFSFN